MKPTLATPVLATSKPAKQPISSYALCPHVAFLTATSTAARRWRQELPLELRKLGFQLSCGMLAGFERIEEE